MSNRGSNRLRTGHRRGDQHPRVRYSEQTVQSVRALRAQGAPWQKIAEDLGIRSARYAQKIGLGLRR